MHASEGNRAWGSSGLSIQETVLVLFLAYWAAWTIYCRLFHPFRDIPGPFLASLSRLWIVWKTTNGDIELTQRDLHARHGYLVRVAPNEVTCSDPDAIKIIYGTKGGFSKTDFYDAWRPPGRGYPGHFAARNEKKHSERRRIVNSIFSMTQVLECEESIDKCTQDLCSALREVVIKRSNINLGEWVHFYSFDVLGELFYGEKFGFMSQGTDVNKYIASIDAMVSCFTIGGTLPSYLTPFLIPLSLILPTIRGAMQGVLLIDKTSKNAVKKRKQEFDHEQDDKRDMLRKLLEVNQKCGDSRNFAISDVVTESTSSLFAGADTTAIALRSVFYHLMRNPSAYTRLVREIDTASADGSLSDPVTYSEAVKLPYLNAVIKEAMRLHPSVGLHMPRTVPAGGAMISGHYFPPGYRVGINAAVIHYDRDVFGPDAAEFNPERWLMGDVSRMERTTLTFGAGTRTCIGKNISLSEIYKLVPQVLRKFEIRLVDPMREWTTHNHWFNKQIGMQVYVEQREKKTE